MGLLTVDEMIFARVESAYSPRGSAGYQTVHRTRGLDDSTVKTIEERVQSFAVQDLGFIRRQFFQVRSRWVVTATRVVESHPEIIDRSKRPGAFLAHCWIIGESEFAYAANNPFRLFARMDSPFDPEDLREHYLSHEHRDREPRQVQASHVDPASHQPGGAALLSLIQLARKADPDGERETSHVFLRREVDLNSALEDVFYHLPAPYRLRCTFDTGVDGARPRAGMYWAVGSDRSIASAGFRPWQPDATTSESSNDLYSHWLENNLRQGTHDPLQVPRMRALCDAYERKKPAAIREVGIETIESFLRFFVQRIEDDLSRTLLPLLGSRVTKGFWKHASESAPLGSMQAAAARFSVASGAADLLFNWLLIAWPTLDDGEWKMIRSFGELHDHPGLRFLAAVRPRKINERRRNAALVAMNETHYKRLIEHGWHELSPEHFLTDRFTQLFLSMDPLAVPAAELLPLALALAERAPDLLPRLAHRLHEFDMRELKRLRKATKSTSPKSFTKQLDSVINQQKEGIRQHKSESPDTNNGPSIREES